MKTRSFNPSAALLVPSVLVCVLALICTLNIASADPSPTFDNDKVLLITDLSVVADPTRTYDPCDLDGDGHKGTVDGAWSLKTLLANTSIGYIIGPNGKQTVSAQEYINYFLILWKYDQTVNGYTIKARPNIANFFPGWDGTAAKLNINKLPFRLLAIANRSDLAAISGMYGVESTGETRFVFGLVDPTSCTPQPMTMSINYNNNPYYGGADSQAQGLINLNDAWIALNQYDLGSANYLNGLEAITDTVTGKPASQYSTTLDSIQTNDFAFGNRWQMRNFVFSYTFYAMTAGPLQTTPDRSYNQSSTLQKILLSRSGSYSVFCQQGLVPSSNNLGASIDYEADAIWQAGLAAYAANNPDKFNVSYPSGDCTEKPGNLLPINTIPPLDPSGSWTDLQLASELRYAFSLNTCNGCHGGETGTYFNHVTWSQVGNSATLSEFLTGGLVADPAGSGLIRAFSELTQRAQFVWENSSSAQNQAK